MIEYLLGSDDENGYKVAYKLALVAFGIMVVLNVMLLAKLSRWI
jgi:hypothetical protein